MSNKRVSPEVGEFAPVEVAVPLDKGWQPIEVNHTPTAPVVEITEPTTGKKEN